VLVLFGRSDPKRRQQAIKRLAIFDPKLLETDIPLQVEKEITDGLAAAQRAAAKTN